MPPVAAQHYTTPARVWQLGLPIKTLFGPDSNLAPGAVTPPVKLAGTGTGTIAAEGNPHDSYSDVRIRCISAGSVNQRAQVNPGQLPIFQISYNGGLTWGNAIQASADEDTALIDDVTTGLRFKLSGSTPAFATSDIWQTSATPSPDITALIGVCSSGCNQFLVGSFKLPLVTWPEFLERIVAWLVRWELVVKRGISHDQTMAQYNPEQKSMQLMGWSAVGWLQAAQRGDFQDDPDFSGAGSSFVYSDIMLPQVQAAPFGTRTWKP